MHVGVWYVDFTASRITITCLTLSGSDFSAATSPAIVAANRLPPNTRAPALLATNTVWMPGRRASQPRIARLCLTHERLSRGFSVVGTPNVNGQLVRAMLAARQPLARASTLTAGRQCVAWLSPISATFGGPCEAGMPNQHTLIGHARLNGSQGASVSSRAAIGRGDTTCSSCGLKHGCFASRDAAPKQRPAAPACCGAAT